mmetsp:Transcript_30427/g.55050  ORF Transcript_30427/g.55050 Transcript_30427/m.55050 type:complete len:85 (-) Transcript_30427:1369-1623(-)
MCPSPKVSKEAQTCVNDINPYDAVPFLCGDSVRHQITMIAAVDKAGLDLVQRAKLLLWIEKPDPVVRSSDKSTTFSVCLVFLEE